MIPLLRPHIFEAFANVLALQTTREGGVSEGDFASLNLGLSSGDLPERVLKNREILSESIGIEQKRFVRSNQVHGDSILIAECGGTYDAYDAYITNRAGVFMMPTITRLVQFMRGGEAQRNPFSTKPCLKCKKPSAQQAKHVLRLSARVLAVSIMKWVKKLPCIFQPKLSDMMTHGENSCSTSKPPIAFNLKPSAFQRHTLKSLRIAPTRNTTDSFHFAIAKAKRAECSLSSG